jgi:hypothetical protein
LGNCRFIDFLKAAGLFDAFAVECPLRYTSPNEPKKRDVLGTTMLSMLSGHKRYAHIAGLRCDSVLPELLGMNKIISEDAMSDRLITRPYRGVLVELLRDWVIDHMSSLMPCIVKTRDSVYRDFPSAHSGQYVPDQHLTPVPAADCAAALTVSVAPSPGAAACARRSSAALCAGSLRAKRH